MYGLELFVNNHPIISTCIAVFNLLFGIFIIIHSERSEK